MNGCIVLECVGWRFAGNRGCGGGIRKDTGCSFVDGEYSCGAKPKVKGE